MVVGVTEDLIRLKSRLTARASKLDITPIVGMGGTGKTTLARILYDEFSSSNSHFDRCGWVTLSQSYNPQLILQTLLACVTGKTLREIQEMPQQETGNLIVTLYKTLFSRRYLIVLDDIWSCNAWDEVQMAFPKDDLGSRIILTTRENIVAEYVKSNSHQMRLISMDDSWELLSRKVFGKKSCPSELEEIGKRIAMNCGLLSQSEISKDFWEHVEHNVSSLIAKADDQFSGIFSLSFAQLPHYLKPCFLYMGAFPEDHKIEASKLIRMWVAEGFLYPIQGKSLEEAAEIHLNVLVERNLIFVRERKSTGKAKSYGIHDLLRDLCLKKAHEKKFVYLIDSKTNVLDDTLCLRRVIVHSSDIYEEHFVSLELKSHARSFQLSGRPSSETHTILSCLCYESSSLRVLDVFNYYAEMSILPEEILRLVNLRYLANWAYVPNSISVLRNLQTLIVFKIESIALPLVNMPQLRQLRFHLLKQKSYDEGSFSSFHENLQRLSRIPLETLAQLLGKLPNLRRLRINSEDAFHNVVDLNHFHKLESLTSMGPPTECTLLSKVILPDSLKKLTLFYWSVDQEFFDAIGVLPNLRILKLEYCSFKISTWEPCEGGFCELQYLSLVYCSGLENWIADETHFPVLRHLILEELNDLTEIPNDIGSIDSLETIKVRKCRISVHDSAVRIVDEQRQFGNTLLQLSSTIH